MKASTKNPKKSIEYTNIIKAGSLFSWIILLSVAHTNNILIETFLFSVAIAFIAYYSINNGSKSNNIISSEGNSRKSRSIQKSERYLNVFFVS